MSAFDNFMGAFFPNVLRRRQQEMMNDRVNQALQGLIPFADQEGERPFQPDSFGPEDPINQQLQPMDLREQFTNKGLFNMDQAKGLAQFLANPKTAGFGQSLMQSLMPQQGDGYTLSPGQIRFGPNGEPIAYGGDVPKDDDKDRNYLLQAEKDLRDNYQKNLAKFAEVQSSYKGLRTTLTNASGPAAVASIVQFVKTLDPGSVVRQEEGRAVVESSGLPEDLVGRLNQLLGTSGPLTPNVRQDLSDVVHDLYNESYKRASLQSAQYEAPIASRNLDRKNVMMGLGIDWEPMQSMTIPGADIPFAPSAAAERRIGKVYKTPKGNMRWLGGGSWAEP